MIPVKTAHRWLTVANALTETQFILPVLMLFYGYKGVNMGDFFLIQGICCIAIFILEVPTGYISDIFSRKNTILLGAIAWIIGYLFLIFGYGFTTILTGELCFALAISLMSGTIEAYLYDLLKKRHKEGSFHKKYAKMKTLSNLTIMVGALSGAFLYQFIGPTAPLWATVIGLMITATILILLPDVPESKRIVAENKSKWQDICDISKYALKHQELKWLMLFPAFYGTMTLILMWGLQSVMITKNVPVFMFSVVMSANAFMRVIWSGFSSKALEKLNLSGILVLQSIVITIAAIGASIAEYTNNIGVYVCLFLMILGSSSVVLSNITSSVLINHRIKSDERATILSVGSMVNRIFWSIGMIGLKPLFDTLSLSKTFLITSLMLFPIIFCARHLYKMKLKTMGER